MPHGSLAKKWLSILGKKAVLSFSSIFNKAILAMLLNFSVPLFSCQQYSDDDDDSMTIINY